MDVDHMPRSRARLETATPARGAGLRAIARSFIVNNPLFLASAMSILAGTMLLNPPDAGGRRSLELLEKLLLAIVAYEGALLGAAAVLARRPGLSRDVTHLVFVLSPFVLDVTFTKTALATKLLDTHGTGTAIAFAVAALTASLAGAFVAGRVNLRAFSPVEWAALFAGPLVVTAYPLAARILADDPCSVLGAGAAAGAVAIFLAWTTSTASPGAAAVRAISPVILAALALHAGATTWTLEGGDMRLLAGPLVIALGLALPALAWPALAPIDRVTPFFLPIVGALICGSPDGSGIQLRHGIAGATPWTVGLCGLVLVHGFLAVRWRSALFLAGAAGGLVLMAGGHTVDRSVSSLGHNWVEPVLLSALFGYAVWKQAPFIIAAVPLVASAWLGASLLPWHHELAVMAGFQAVGVGVLAWSHRVEGRAPDDWTVRIVGLLFLCAPPVAALLATDSVIVHQLAMRTLGATLGLLLIASIALRLVPYALPPLVASLVFAAIHAPTTADAWGVVGIAAAFVAVGLGVALSLGRERLIALLDEPAPVAVAIPRVAMPPRRESAAPLSPPASPPAMPATPPRASDVNTSSTSGTDGNTSSSPPEDPQVPL